MTSLTKGPILKQIVWFSLPYFIASLFQQLYNLVDMVIVGRTLGQMAYTAVGSTETVTKDEAGNEKKRVDSLGTTAVYVNKYEGELLVEVKATFSNNSKVTVTVTKYEYDARGNITKQTSYDNIGNVLSTITFEYSSNVEFVE